MMRLYQYIKRKEDQDNWDLGFVMMNEEGTLQYLDPSDKKVRTTENYEEGIDYRYHLLWRF